MITFPFARTTVLASHLCMYPCLVGQSQLYTAQLAALANDDPPRIYH